MFVIDQERGDWIGWRIGWSVACAGCLVVNSPEAKQRSEQPFV
jgi:hypothetical protein